MDTLGRYETAAYPHRPPPIHSRLPSLSSHPRTFDPSVVPYAPEQDHRIRHREAPEVLPGAERYYHDDEDADADTEEDDELDDLNDIDMAVVAGRTQRARTVSMPYDPTLESTLSRPLTYHERELL